MPVRGTTTKRAGYLTEVSRRARPATSGNKNVRATASRKSASAMVARGSALLNRTHAGPGL